MSAKVVVCQIGAREHYGLAAALHAEGRLAALATDVWAPPGSALAFAGRLAGRRGRRLADRHSAALAGAPVVAAGPLALAAAARIARRTAPGWPRVMAHNAWFGAHAAQALAARGILASRPAVFAYSYAALEILRAARRAGSATLLGQIDPGPAEDDLVAEVAARHGLCAAASRPPAAYWERWHEECDLADRIVVNSAWSRTLLVRAGVAAAKIAVVPLALAAPPPPAGRRLPPPAFTAERPLEVLFLGQVGVRKGVVELVEAMARLVAEPIRLTLVGLVEPQLAPRLGASASANVAVVGAVPRSAAVGCYDRADVMILPTHSDGFAITQLEAQGAGLPLVVSAFCGSVVEHGTSGIVLPAVTAAAIEAALRGLVADPTGLAAMALAAPAAAARFTLERAAREILDLVDALGSGCIATDHGVPPEADDRTR